MSKNQTINNFRQKRQAKLDNLFTKRIKADSQCQKAGWKSYELSTDEEILQMYDRFLIDQSVDSIKNLFLFTGDFTALRKVIKNQRELPLLLGNQMITFGFLKQEMNMICSYSPNSSVNSRFQSFLGITQNWSKDLCVCLFYEVLMTWKSALIHYRKSQASANLVLLFGSPAVNNK